MRFIFFVKNQIANAARRTEKIIILPFFTYSMTDSPKLKYRLKNKVQEIVHAIKSAAANLRKFILPRPAVKNNPFLTPKGMKSSKKK